ncbi:hypothetical protein GCM10025860_05570 [Methanobacterium ferruginis]|nr:hypothetical protein GCM10025860_05570 [Methanobacterium ferruginis]
MKKGYFTYKKFQCDFMIEMYQKAGRIVKEVRELAVDEVHEGMKVLDLINLIESEIKKKEAYQLFHVTYP